MARIRLLREHLSELPVIDKAEQSKHGSKGNSLSLYVCTVCTTTVFACTTTILH